MYSFETNFYFDHLRVFDKDEDDHLSIMELKKVLTTMGQRMKKTEFAEMIKSVSVKENGLIHLQGTTMNTQKSYRSEAQLCYVSMLFLFLYCKFYNIRQPEVIYYCNI